MASVNKVIIVGNLGRDPEVKYMPSGDAIANIAVATSYKSKDRNTGEQKELTEWHRIAFFGRLAEIVGQYLRKGASVYVEGRLQTRKYTDKDGVEKYATDIIAENMQMLGGRADAAQESDHRTPPQPQYQQERPSQQGYDGDYGRATGGRAAPPPPPPQRPASRQAPAFPDHDVPF